MKTEIQTKTTKHKAQLELEAFYKVICLGQGISQSQVFCKIEYTKKGTLSISGVEGPTHNGNARGGCGQIVGTQIIHANIKEGWTQEKIEQFYTVWLSWHLNDLQAGCKHQRAENWSSVRINPVELPESHANCDKKGILAIWVTEKEHHKGLLCKICKVCGYKYGTRWLFKDIPNDVLRFLKQLSETTKKYAWI